MDHVVVSTGDPERAAALYGARLGLDMALDRSHPDWGRLMFFRCGDLIVEVTHRPGKDADTRRTGCGACAGASPTSTPPMRGWPAPASTSRKSAPAASRARGCMTVRSGTCGVPTLLVERTARRIFSVLVGAAREAKLRLLADPLIRRAFARRCSHDGIEHAHSQSRAHATCSLHSHRAPILAKAKRTLKWQRDPEGMRLRILEAAKQEFAAHGLAGARVDRIAAKAGANKRMLYYHVGNKEDLYLAVLEGAYEKIRAEERGLDLEHLDPPEAIERLIDFTWNYFIRNPEFLALLNTENLAKARHLKRSTKVKSMHSPFVEMIRTVVRRGVESGDFRVAVDPVQLYISIAALCFFYLSNSATLSVIFGRDLLKKEAQGRAARAHGGAGAGGADREIDGGFRQEVKAAEAAGGGTAAGVICPEASLPRCQGTHPSRVFRLFGTKSAWFREFYALTNQLIMYLWAREGRPSMRWEACSVTSE